MCAFSYLWTFVFRYLGKLPTHPSLLSQHHEVIKMTKLISAFYLLECHKTLSLKLQITRLFL